MARCSACRSPLFVKRAAFALLASLALHDKTAPDARFVQALAVIEREADDDRNFVRKGVLWGLRGIGSRSARLRDAALSVAERLAARPGSSARWIGRQAIRELNSQAARRRIDRVKAPPPSAPLRA